MVTPRIVTILFFGFSPWNIPTCSHSNTHTTAVASPLVSDASMISTTRSDLKLCPRPISTSSRTICAARSSNSGICPLLSVPAAVRQDTAVGFGWLHAHDPALLRVLRVWHPAIHQPEGRFRPVRRWGRRARALGLVDDVAVGVVHVEDRRFHVVIPMGHDPHPIRAVRARRVAPVVVAATLRRRQRRIEDATVARVLEV